MYNTITLGLIIATSLAIMIGLSTNIAFSSSSTNVTASVSNLTSATTPIYEQHSQTHGNRVIDVTNRTANLEVSYSGNGFAKSISVTDQGTLLYTLKSTGAVNGTGQGYIISTDGEMATYTLRGGGTLNKEGNASFQGIIHFNGIPTGSLAFLSDMKGTIKAEANNNGLLTLQVWQQK